MPNSFRLAVLVTVSLLSLSLTVCVPRAADAAEPASVTVVHGLRGLVADVQVDGRVVLKGFSEERATDPLPLSAGTRRVVIRSARDVSGPAIIDTTVELVAGESRTLVAHLDTQGKPVLTSFRNDGTPIAAGQGRLVLRNTAAVPAVQIVIDGKPLGAVVASGAETDVLLPASAHTVAVMAPGGEGMLLGAQTVDVPAGSSTLLYLIGASRDSSLTWLVQTLTSGPTTAPAGVPTGTSGLKDLARPGGTLGLVAALMLIVAGIFPVPGRRVG